MVAKLEWAKLGESERQLRDTSGILTLRAGELDIEHIKNWVHLLDRSQQRTRWDPGLSGGPPEIHSVAERRATISPHC